MKKLSADEILSQAANTHYKQRKDGLMKRIVGAYKPVYDNKTAGLRPDQRARSARYCNGRMKLWEFVILHVLIIFNLLLIILVPVAYFSLIPMYLQYRVNLIGTDGNAVSIHRVAVGDMLSDTINFAGDFRVAPLFFLPLYAGLKPTVLHLFANEKVLVDINLPETSFWINREVKIAFNGTMTFSEEQLKNTQDFVALLSSPQGISNLQLAIRLNAPMTAFGMQVYSGLPLHRNLDMGSIAANTKDMVSILSAPSNPNLILVTQDTNNNAALHANFGASDIFSLGGFQLIWDKLAFKMDDTSATINIGIAFENPTPLELAVIAEAEYYFTLQNTTIFKMSLQNLGVSPLLNSNFDLGIKFTFLDGNIDPTSVQKAIESAAHGFAQDMDFAFGIVGPVNVTNASFMSTITKNLAVSGRFADLMTLIPQKYKDMLNDPVAIASLLGSIESIIGNSKISLSALSQKIVADLGINIPALDFIVPPKSISFPYGSSLSIYGLNGTKAIENDLSPITITRQGNGTFVVGMVATILPTNTDAAATDLANALNPVLAAVPRASSIGLKDLAFFPPGGAHFKWCDEVFGVRVLNIGLPPINKTYFVDLAVGASPALMKDISKVVTINTLALSQLNSEPGFGAQGNVAVNYPVGAPQLKVDVGFFSTTATVEGVNLVALELPTGLQFAPSSSGTTINGAAILSRDPQFATKVQNLANSFLQHGAPVSYAGVTGLKFGDSASNNIVTFSKVAIDIDSGTLTKFSHDLVSMANPSSLLSHLPTGLVKVQGADMAIVSSQSISISAQNTLNNPYKATASFGSIAMAATLNDQILSGLTIAPLAIGLGSSPLNLGLGMQPSSGANGLAQSVSALVNDVLSSNTASTTTVGVTGLVLSPPGVSSGPAVIDQMKSVKFSVMTGSVIKMVSGLSLSSMTSTLSSTSSPIDISAVMPTSDMLSRLNPSVKFLQAEALPGSTIVAGADLSYSNPLPFSAKVAYFAISPSLNGNVLVDTAVSSVDLQRSSGTMQPRVNMAFKSGVPGLPDTVAKFTTDLLNGQLNTKVGVSGIYFGESPSSRNDLLSAINADLTSIMAPFASYGKSLTDRLPTIVAGFSSGINITQVFHSAAVDVSINQDKSIATNVGADLALPMTFKVNLPYVKVGTALNNNPAFDININGMNINSQAGVSQSLKVNTVVNVHDTDSLADSIASITSALLSSQTIPGTIGGGSMLIGVSSGDYIDTFSKVTISLAINPLVAPILNSNLTSSINFPALIHSLGLQLGTVEVVAKPAKTISAALSVKFDNPFKVSVKGMNYITASSMLGGQEMFAIRSPGIGALSPGENSLNMAIDMIFSSEDASKKAAAAFAQDVSNNFGNTQAVLGVSKAVFGYDQATAFQFLSKAIIGVKSAWIINQKNLDLMTNTLSSAGINATYVMSLVKPTGMSVQFNPSDTINSKLSADLFIPFAVKMQMPYFTFGSAINSYPMLNLEIDGLNIAARGTNSLSLGANIQLKDSAELEDAIASVLAAALKDAKNIPGTVGGGALSFGVDSTPANIIDTFSEVLINVPIKSIAGPISGIVSSTIATVNATALIQSLNLSLKDLNAETEPGRTVHNSFTAGFTSSFPISVQGLGYMTAGAGIDNSKIMSLSASGFSIIPGANSVSLTSDIFFPAIDGTPDKIASFVNNVMNNLGKTEETLFGNGITFGFDKTHTFNLFSKAVLAIPSVWIVNQHNIDFGLKLMKSVDVSTLLSGAFLNKAHLSTLPAGDLVTSIGGGIKNITFGAQAKIGYAHAVTLLDSKPLLDFSMVSPLTLATINNQLALDVSADLLFHNDDSIQSDVASLVKAVLANSSLSNTVGVTGLSFGSDRNSENIVDTFSKVSVSLAILPYIPMLKNVTANLISTAMGILSSPPTGPFSNVKFSMSNMDLDVFDENTLVSNVAATITDLPFDLYLNLPYTFGGLKFNDGDFAFATVKDTLFENGKFSTQAFINIPLNRPAATSVVAIAGNILFHRFIPSTDSVTLNSIGFGFSQEKAVKTLNEVTASVVLTPYVAKMISVVNSTRPIELNDIQAIIDVPGVVTTVHMSVSAPFFKMLAHVDGKCMYQKNGTGPLFTAANIPISVVALPLVKFVLVPDMTPGTGSVAALSAASVPLLTFKDFTSDAILGYPTFTGSNGKVFRNLDQAGFNSGAISLWSPLVINLVPTWPFSFAHPFALKLPIKGVVSFSNDGPFHFDAGHLDLEININGKSVMGMVSEGNVVALNKNEGAAQTEVKHYKTMGQFDITVPLSDLNPITIFNAIKALLDGKGIMPDMKLTQQGREVTYFPLILAGLGQSGVLADIVPFFGTILGHIKVEIFGIDPLKVPIIGPILQEVENKLIGFLQGHVPSSKAVTQLNTVLTNSSTVVMADSNVLQIISHPLRL